MEMNIQLLSLLFISLLISFTYAQSVYQNTEQKNDDRNIISEDGTDKDVMWLYEELDDSTSNTGLNGQSICNYFEVYSNELKIDCNSLKFVLKPRSIAQNHVIRKRDVENDNNLLDGGSGDGEDNTTEAFSYSSEPPAISELPAVPEESTVNAESSEQPLLESSSSLPQSTDDESSLKPQTDEFPIAIKDVESKKARKFNVTATSNPEAPKEIEEINDHQNNNSNTLHPNEIVDDEKRINSMKKSETGNVDEPPNPGESAENAVKASKDTKILIVLFVAVVIIGIGAFLYNFVKKKRQSASITTDTNGQTRNEDPERGQEMKPLMKGKLENGEKLDNAKAGVETEKIENDKVTV